jgi:hypothetical protein
MRRLDAVDGSGGTRDPIAWGARGNRERSGEALQAALDLGNDINAVDKNGEMAMHGALTRIIRRVFLMRMAQIEVWNRKNKQGWTPLRSRRDTGLHLSRTFTVKRFSNC